MTDRRPRLGFAQPDAESSVSDETLVRWLRSGNDAAASRLYSRYVHRLRALARAKLSADLSRRVDAEDIVQSVFRRFFQAARQGNYDVPGGDDLWDLLLVITVNKIRSEKSYQRAAKRDVRRTADNGRDGFSLEQIAERDDLAVTLLRLHVEEALARFPADYRTVVELRMEGHDIRDIARRTGRSKRTVERILQESRLVLRDSLREAD